MGTFQISIPDSLEKRLKEVERKFTTRNSAVVHLLNVALDVEEVKR